MKTMKPDTERPTPKPYLWLEGLGWTAPHLWIPPRSVRVVGEAETGVEIFRLASTLSSDVAVADLAIGEAAGNGCSATLLVMALRFAEVGRVVLFGGEEDLPETNMEEIRKDSWADAAIEAGRIAADLANAVVVTKADPAWGTRTEENLACGER